MKLIISLSLLYVAIMTAVFYVAFHFITKFW